MATIQKLSNDDSVELFERVVDCIKSQKKGFFTLKKLKGLHGYCDWEDGIVLDYRKDFVATIVHECIHFIEPNWSEKQVCYSESRVMNSVKDDDIVRLLMFFVKKL